LKNFLGYFSGRYRDWLLWRKERLGEVESIKVETAEYVRSQNWVGEFVNDRLEYVTYKELSAKVILQEAKKYHFAQMDTEMEKAGWTVDQLRSALKQALEELGWEQYRKRWSWLDILTTPIRQK